MVQSMHGCSEVCNYFSISLTTEQSSLSVRRSSSSLCLLDFLYVLALGNELSGEVVRLTVFADNEGAVKKFSETFQREREDEWSIYCY